MDSMGRKLVKGAMGPITLDPKNGDEIWHAYNLISQGDCVSARTFRKVEIGNDVCKVQVNLEIAVETVDLDLTSSTIRIRGKILTKNDYVRIGVYHTLEVGNTTPFQLSKTLWDDEALNHLEEFYNAKRVGDPESMVILLDVGLAQLFHVGEDRTSLKATVNSPNILRKRKNYDTTIKNFLNDVLHMLLRHVDLAIVKCLVIAGPGCLKDQFYKFITSASMEGNTQMLPSQHMSKIIVAQASSAFKVSLKEVLIDPIVRACINNKKQAQDLQVFQDWLDMWRKDPDRAVYGMDEVRVAHENLAIDTLLLTESHFRSTDVDVRKKFVVLVDAVKENGGHVHILSSMHISGQQLDQHTGVAAILRFPMPELNDLDHIN